MCISREQEEFLASYRTDEARQAFIDSYGKEKVNFLDSGYGENISKPIFPEPIFPYDNELEYIEFTGTQYLGLGVHGSLDIGCDIGFSLTTSLVNLFVFGCRLAQYTDALFVTFSRTGDRFVCSFGNGNATELISYFKNISSKFRVVVNRSLREVYENGVVIGRNTYEYFLPFETPHQLYVGRSDSSDGVGTVVNNFVGRYYYVKLYRDGVEFMHLIPVVKDGVGCMYDLYTRELFYNIGEGEFVLGPVVEN